MRYQRKLDKINESVASFSTNDLGLQCPNPKCTKNIIDHNNIEATICAAFVTLIKEANTRRVWRLK